MWDLAVSDDDSFSFSLFLSLWFGLDRRVDALFA
jgi:hypothetical protein